MIQPQEKWRRFSSYWRIGCIVLGLSLYFVDLQSASAFFSKSAQTCTALVKGMLGGTSGSHREEPLVTAGLTRPPRTFVSGSIVSDYGTVIRILDDDNTGSRHQRFIIKLSTGQTLLIAHNIDIAPRINNLSMGDTVSFFGQYEANSKGGVIHRTHRDPKGLHAAGFLNHKGQIYQ